MKFYKCKKPNIHPTLLYNTEQFHFSKNVLCWLGGVTHTYNLSYSLGGGWEDDDLKSDLVKWMRDLISPNKLASW
jgi:hypothetical protein